MHGESQRGLLGDARSRFGLAMGLVLVCLVLAPAGASAESLCTDTWSGASEGSWGTASNWSAGRVPGASDVACIGAGKTADVSEGSDHAGVIQGEGGVAISAGSLEVASALEASRIKNLTGAGGALTGPAKVTI